MNILTKSSVMFTAKSSFFCIIIATFAIFMKLGESTSCDSRPCAHTNATCINTNNASEFLCICPPNWTGLTCDIGSCLQRGICSTKETNVQRPYTCECEKGYFGDICELADPCISSPCHSTATCIPGKFNNVTCNCPITRTGALCEIAINPCSSSPCIHGVCKNIVPDFKCVCDDVGYTGIFCDSELYSVDDITVYPINQTVLAGQLTNVTANLTYIERFATTSDWYYNGKRVAYNCTTDFKHTSEIADPIQSICRTSEQGSGIDVLSFPSATFEFTGSYEFSVTLRIYNNTRYVKKFWIQVEGAPNSMRMIPNGHSPYIIQRYSNFSLSCNANGMPSPEVYLMYRNSREKPKIISAGKSPHGLVLTKLRLQNTGTYFCLAVNKHGKLRKNITIIIAAPPETVSDITVNDVTNRSCLVTFLPGYQGITKSFHFLVYYQLKNNNTEWLTRKVLCLINNCIIKDLYPRSIYYIWVTAVNDFGESNNSKIVLIKTKDKPSKPKIIRAITTSNSSQIVWIKPVSDPVLPVKYLIRYKPSHDLRFRAIQPMVEKASIIGVQETFIRNLAINTSYDFQLQFTNTYGSSYSDIFIIATKGFPNQPKIRNIDSNMTNITVFWDDVSYNGGYNLSAITYYAECYTTSDVVITSTCNSCYKSDVKKFNNTKATVRYLEERTLYQCRIAAINVVGVIYSSWLLKKTKGLPMPPETVTADAVTETILFVRWSRARFDGVLLHYLVHYRTINSIRYMKKIVDHGGISTNLTNLSTDEVYQIYVTTTDSYGNSKPSPTIHVSTRMQSQSTSTRIMTSPTTPITAKSITSPITSMPGIRPSIIGMGVGFSVAGIVLLSFICIIGMKLWKHLQKKELYLIRDMHMQKSSKINLQENTVSSLESRSHYHSEDHTYARVKKSNTTRTLPIEYKSTTNTSRIKHGTNSTSSLRIKPNISGRAGTHIPLDSENKTTKKKIVNNPGEGLNAEHKELYCSVGAKSSIKTLDTVQSAVENVATLGVTIRRSTSIKDKYERINHLRNEKLATRQCPEIGTKANNEDTLVQSNLKSNLREKNSFMDQPSIILKNKLKTKCDTKNTNDPVYAIVVKSAINDEVKENFSNTLQSENNGSIAPDILPETRISKDIINDEENAKQCDCVVQSKMQKIENSDYSEEDGYLETSLKDSTDINGHYATIPIDKTKSETSSPLSPTGFQNKNNIPDIVAPIDRETLKKGFKIDLLKLNSPKAANNLHHTTPDNSETTLQKISTPSSPRLSSPDLPKRRWSSSRRRVHNISHVND
ncbi:Delta and Notch-like epidermal growth factor-related receptor [Trichoplax sp. H2]|nr:Delta and Notch-like epidermal growth factor-related receptor [Trichoplax sp. H2]|eukprot:RDD46154.1 Delta and Notch-like epidermal growth factor-related receptor [Trichoplax sp. H2]